MSTAVVPAARSTGNYGCRRNAGAHDPACPPGQRRHHGTDISAPEGSPIYTPLGGVVQRVFPNGALSRYGNLFIQYVPDLNVTLVFAHLFELPRRADGSLWRQGDTVSAGDQVGRVGYTGACGRSRVSVRGVACTPCGPGGAYLCSGPSGAHLHFEVRPGRVSRPNPLGGSVNPVLFAREQGFSLVGGGGGLGGLGGPRLGGLGAVFTTDRAQCDGIKYYCDPTGFEPGDGESGGWSWRSVVKVGLAVLGGLAAIKVGVALARR